VLELINLRQGNVSVKKDVLRFTQLSRYAPTIVVDSRASISKFVLGLSELVVKKYHTTMLVHDIDNSHLIVYAQQIEEEKHKERSKETKRARTSDGNFSYAMFDGHGHSRFLQ